MNESHHNYVLYTVGKKISPSWIKWLLIEICILQSYKLLYMCFYYKLKKIFDHFQICKIHNFYGVRML
jgi:hypothetical protein